MSALAAAAAATFTDDDDECVGDSSRDVLGNLRHTTKVLLQGALLDLRRAKDKEPKSLDDIKSERDRLHQERLSLQVELEFRKGLSSEPPNSSTVDQEEHSKEKVEEQVEELEEQLLSLKLQYRQDKKILECLHGHEFLMKELFLKDINSDNSPPSAIQQSFHQETGLTSELLHNVKELEKLRKDILLVKRKRVDAQYQCRKLMAQLNELQMTDCTTNNLENDSDNIDSILQKSLDEAILLRHTLLCLIGGSGVDWSQDEELCDLVTNLGQF